LVMHRNCGCNSRDVFHFWVCVHEASCENTAFIPVVGVFLQQTHCTQFSRTNWGILVQSLSKRKLSPWRVSHCVTVLWVPWLADTQAFIFMSWRSSLYFQHTSIVTFVQSFVVTYKVSGKSLIILFLLRLVWIFEASL
jgi:hypothetical protein